MRNPLVTALPCQPPLGKGAIGTGGYGLPRARCALAMTHFTRGAVVNGGGLRVARPTDVFFQIKKENAGGVLLTA